MMQQRLVVGAPAVAVASERLGMNVQPAAVEIKEVAQVVLVVTIQVPTTAVQVAEVKPAPTLGPHTGESRSYHAIVGFFFYYSGSKSL